MGFKPVFRFVNIYFIHDFASTKLVVTASCPQALIVSDDFPVYNRLTRFLAAFKSRSIGEFQVITLALIIRPLVAHKDLKVKSLCRILV
jgi:hypothetical protein